MGKFDLKTTNILTENNYLDLIDDKPIYNQPEHFNSELAAGSFLLPVQPAYQKGLFLSHKNLIANTTSIIEYLNLTENDIVEVVMPFFYCYGLSLLHTHLRIGIDCSK